MYWRAMTTRFCVGMFTPAMRATSVSQERRLLPRRHRPPSRCQPSQAPDNARKSAPAHYPPGPIAGSQVAKVAHLLAEGPSLVNASVPGSDAHRHPASFDPAQDLVDVAGNVGDRAHAVHRVEVTFAEIVADERRRLPVVDHQSGGDGRLIVIGTTGELRRL